MSALQPFSPLAPVDFQAFSGSSFEIASSPFSTGNSIVMPDSAAGGAGFSSLGTVLSFASLGLQAFNFVSTLGSISDSKSAVRAEAARKRKIAHDISKFNNDMIGLKAFRLKKTQRAINAGTGVAFQSQSFTKLQDRVETDKDFKKQQVFTKLDETLFQIQAEESAALKKLSGLKTSSIIKFGTSVVGTVAAPFTGGASLLLASGATAV